MIGDEGKVGANCKEMPSYLCASVVNIVVVSSTFYEFRLVGYDLGMDIENFEVHLFLSNILTR